MALGKIGKKAKAAVNPLLNLLPTCRPALACQAVLALSAIELPDPAKPGSGHGACEVSDQRGNPLSAPCDLGAYEYGK